MRHYFNKMFAFLTLQQKDEKHIIYLPEHLDRITDW